jgi:hypothetical protein
MKFLSYFLFLAVLAISCKPAHTEETPVENAPVDELAVLEAQVMALHDEVMPKMQEITKLQTTLRSYKNEATETPEGKIAYPHGLDMIMGDLKLAEQGMWDWMKAYSDTKANLTPDQMESFYKKELVSITKVKTDMLKAIEKGQAWIDANPK